MKIETDKDGYLTRVYPHHAQNEDVRGFEHYLGVCFHVMNEPSHVLVTGIGQFPQPPSMAVASGLAAIKAALIGQMQAIKLIEQRGGLSKDTTNDETFDTINDAEYQIDFALDTIAQASTILQSVIANELPKVMYQHELDFMAKHHPQPRAVDPPPPAPETPEQKMLNRIQQD